ncbi:hypothetical protein, partial [Alicyclobacillus acidiphilus]|uniref:hypothetical protein n=1 Tax=Alicyclobacillus acidiphilus TaxID=182455 RepID=UPI001C3F1686
PHPWQRTMIYRQETNIQGVPDVHQYPDPLHHQYHHSTADNCDGVSVRGVATLLVGSHIHPTPDTVSSLELS